MFHGSHQLARLKYALDMNEALAVARDQAKTMPDPVRSGLLVNEMARRHQFIMKARVIAQDSRGDGETGFIMAAPVEIGEFITS